MSWLLFYSAQHVYSFICHLLFYYKILTSAGFYIFKWSTVPLLSLFMTIILFRYQYAPSMHEQVFISQNFISSLRMTLLGVDPTMSSMFSLKYTSSWCHFQNAIEKTHHCVTAEFPLWRVFGNWFQQPSHSGALSARNGLDAVMFSFIFNSSSENYTCSLLTPGIGQT